MPQKRGKRKERDMKIAVIGNGNIGAGLNGALARAGHDTATYGREDDLAAAIAGAEVVILATPFGAAPELAGQADFAGKLVVDLSNPVTADFSGLQLGHDRSAAPSRSRWRGLCVPARQQRRRSEILEW